MRRKREERERQTKRTEETVSRKRGLGADGHGGGKAPHKAQARHTLKGAVQTRHRPRGT